MQLERKMTALEGERDVLKNLLNQAQKERDDLMRQVNRLHSQGIFFKKFQHEPIRRNQCSHLLEVSVIGKLVLNFCFWFGWG